MKQTSYHAFHDWDDQVRIKDVILEKLADGLPHNEILQAVLRRFPRAQTSIVSVRFYAWKIRLDKSEAGPKAPQGLVPEAILAGFADPEVLELVQSEHPNAATSLNSISSTRSKMRKLDPTIPTSAQALRLRGLA